MPRVYGNSPGKLSDSCASQPGRESDVYKRPRGRPESVVNCAWRSRGVLDFGLLSDMRNLFLGRRSVPGTVELPSAPSRLQLPGAAKRTDGEGAEEQSDHDRNPDEPVRSVAGPGTEGGIHPANCQEGEGGANGLVKNLFGNPPEPAKSAQFLG